MHVPDYWCCLSFWHASERQRERENWELPRPEAGVETDLEIAQGNCGANHNWCIRNCLERPKKVVSRDWCHMSFGIIAESMLTGYSENPLQSLRHLRSRVVTWCLKKTPASHPEASFQDDINNNNHNIYPGSPLTLVVFIGVLQSWNNIIVGIELSLNQSPLIDCRIELSLKPPLINGHPLESVWKWVDFFCSRCLFCFVRGDNYINVFSVLLLAMEELCSKQDDILTTKDAKIKELKRRLVHQKQIHQQQLSDLDIHRQQEQYINYNTQKTQEKSTTKRTRQKRVSFR